LLAPRASQGIEPGIAPSEPLLERGHRFTGVRGPFAKART